jgi:hypothetical protein
VGAEAQQATRRLQAQQAAADYDGLAARHGRLSDFKRVGQSAPGKDAGLVIARDWRQGRPAAHRQQEFVVGSHIHAIDGHGLGHRVNLRRQAIEMDVDATFFVPI